MKVGLIAIVLRDSNGVIEIQNAMPPRPWNKHCFPGILDALNILFEVPSCLEPRQDKVKILDRLIILALLR